MLTPQDVRSVQFEKNLRGYRTEDVDRFLDKVEEQLQQNDAQAEQLRKQIADLTAENQKLKGELQSFEADGDMLKSALINAQRMGENVIREANQKAEEIIHRANLRGDDIIRDANELLQKASDAQHEIENEADARSRLARSGGAPPPSGSHTAIKAMCSICPQPCGVFEPSAGVPEGNQGSCTGRPRTGRRACAGDCRRAARRTA